MSEVQDQVKLGVEVEGEYTWCYIYIMMADNKNWCWLKLNWIQCSRNSIIVILKTAQKNKKNTDNDDEPQWQWNWNTKNSAWMLLLLLFIIKYYLLIKELPIMFQNFETSKPLHIDPGERLHVELFLTRTTDGCMAAMHACIPYFIKKNNRSSHLRPRTNIDDRTTLALRFLLLIAAISN